MSITEIAIKRPSLIIVIFLVLTIGGFVSYQKLSYELMPEFAEPTLIISVPYPGASPSEVENSVTKKLEDAVSGLENLREVNSKSYESLSVLIVNFKVGTNLDLVIQEAQRKIDNVKYLLPEEVKSPSISKVSPGDMPFMQLTATSMLSERDFYDLADDKILPQLQQIKGIAEITMLGGQQREIRIQAGSDKLKFYGMSLLQLNQAIAGANIDFPTGKVKTTEEQITVRLAGKFTSVEDIKNLVVFKTPQGSPVRVTDVAEVTDDIKEAASLSRYNLQNGIGLLIKKQSGANAVEISQQIKNTLAGIEKMYAAQNVKFIIASDDTNFTIASVEAVQHDLVIAIVLVAAIMLLFLHSLRNALIVMIAIPASLVSTFIVMAVLDYSLNLMTLLAMSLVIGILVDDSIVVLENITRHLEMGKDKRTAAVEGRKEIGFSAMAITFVDVVVFLPIVLFVNTTIGDILRQFSVMVVVSTLMSLFVSFTITPWLASRWGKITHLNPKNPVQAFLLFFERGLDGLTNTYVSMLKWCLHHKILASLMVIGLFFLTGVVMNMGILGEELVAEGDQGKFTIKLEYDKNTTLQKNSLRTREVEEYLLRQPEVISVFSNIGGPSIAFGATGQGSPNASELTVTLVPAEERSLETAKYMIKTREELQKKYAGVEIGSSVIGIVQGGPPIELILKGADYAKVIATGKKIREIISNLPGANDVQVSVEDGMPEANITIDRERMANLGLDMGTVGATLRTAFAGNDDARYKESGNEYDIRIIMDAFDRKNPEDVANISFVNQQGQQVQLSQFATIAQSTGPSQLERKDRMPSLSITCYNLGTTTGVLSTSIDEALAKNNVVPPDVILKWGGDTERQQESMGALGSALLIGMVLVYLIMVALYDNFVYPFVVLFSIPVSLIGAFLALNIAMSSFSIFTMLGIIMLLGLVAKNAILIVDFANQMKAEGYRTYTALLLAGKTRLRPIIMTTIAMVIGMMPIAVATGAGAEWKNGLALVLVGGLLSSMLLTVFVVPMAYYTVDRISEKWQSWQKKKVKEPEMARV